MSIKVITPLGVEMIEAVQENSINRDFAHEGLRAQEGCGTMLEYKEDVEELFLVFCCCFLFIYKSLPATVTTNIAMVASYHFVGLANGSLDITSMQQKCPPRRAFIW